MATRRRDYIEGLSQHIIQRGNNRIKIFQTLADYQTFGFLLGRAAGKHGVALNGYVFMTTHVHLVATPSAETSLSKMMHAVGFKYADYFNTRYQRTGSLWEGPYRSSLIDSEHYWWICMRYVEHNPVRAQMVAMPHDYRWSSYRSHALGEVDQLLMPHPLYTGLGTTTAERQVNWREVCGQSLPEDELATVRYAVHRGLRLGDHFDAATSEKLARIPYAS